MSHKDILHLDTTTQGASSSAPKCTECWMNKCQGMLQHPCREHKYVQSPLLALPKLVTHKAPSLSGCNLNKASDDNWSPVGSCLFLPGNKKMSTGIWSVQATTLIPLSAGLKSTFLIPLKHLQGIRYLRNAEKRNTHAGETQLQVTLNQ